LIWIILGVLLTMVVHSLRSQPQGKELSFSEFLQMVDEGQVEKVTIRGNHVSGTLKGGETFRTYTPYYPRLLDLLRIKGVKISAVPEESSSWYTTVLVSWLPLLVLVGLWVLFMRQMQAGGGKAWGFGRSRAKVATEQQTRVTFEDVAGVEEAKEELKEIIEFLKDPKQFTQLGGRIPKGVLLVGPPGTGKTLLAKAIAGEAGVPFFSISGSDFVEMFVGVGASRVRDLFNQGRRHAPCIIFIDEIDAVGRYRGAGLGGGHDEREQTLNQLLVELDGFDSKEGLIVIAATNRPDVLDPALLRPGRFDRQIVVPTPDVRGRLEILKVHTRKVPLAEDVKLEVIARGTPGFTGADLANLVNEAVILAAREGKKRVDMTCFEQAKDKVLMGVERKSIVLSPAEKRCIAYHEAGHALVAKLLPGADPVHKVSIIPRGMALGITQQLPIDDRHTYPRSYLLTTITVLLGGRASEELVLGDLTTGAGSDLERATEIARKMVCQWGMSQLGPLTFGKREEHVFLGKELGYPKEYSEETARRIDEEVQRIVTDCYQKAKGILSENIHLLHALAQLLLEREMVGGAEIEELIKRQGASAHA